MSVAMNEVLSIGGRIVRDEGDRVMTYDGSHVRLWVCVGHDAWDMRDKTPITLEQIRRSSPEAAARAARAKKRTTTCE